MYIDGYNKLFTNTSMLENYAHQTDRLCGVLLSDCTGKDTSYHVRATNIIVRALADFCSKSNGFSGDLTVGCRVENNHITGYEYDETVFIIVPSILVESDVFTFGNQTEKDSERHFRVGFNNKTGLIRVYACFGIDEHGFPDVTIPLFAWHPEYCAVGMSPNNFREIGIPVENRTRIMADFAEQCVYDYMCAMSDAYRYLGDETLDFIDDTRYAVLKLINSAIHDYNKKLEKVSEDKNCPLDDM